MTHRSLSPALVSVIVVAGLALRALVLSGPLGGADADEAVVGLMAMDLLTGDATTFFWGQAYGGSQEAMLASAAFVVAWPHRLVLKSVPIALNAVAAVLVWRIGGRLIGQRAAALAALAFWVASSSFVWWSTKARGHYSVLLVLELLLVLLALRVQARVANGDLAGWRLKREAALLGFVAGLAWWASPQIGYVALPLAPWLLHALRRHVLLIWPAVPGAMIGALPWLRFNLLWGWPSLRIPEGAGPKPSVLEQLRGFSVEALPRAAGFRLSFSSEWVPPILGPLAFLATAVLIVLAWHRRRPPAPLLAGIVLAYPVLFLVSPVYYVADPRYLYFLWPFLALLIGMAIDHAAPKQAMALGVILLLAVGSWWGIERMITQGRAVFHAPDVAVPADLTGLVEALKSQQAERVFAHYALAYPITFESGKVIVATPIASVRNPTLNEAVRSDPSPGYVFMADSSWVQAFREATDRLGVDAHCERLDQFVLCRPSPKLLPEQLGEVWFR